MVRSNAELIVRFILFKRGIKDEDRWDLCQAVKIIAHFQPAELIVSNLGLRKSLL